MYKSDLLKSIDFPKNIAILEDFVFWSRVLFLHPRACIIKIPLYSYTENYGSALHTTDYIKSVHDLISAIDLAYKYLQTSDISCMNTQRWKSRFMWDILSRVYSYIKRIDDKKSLKKIHSSLVKLQESGVFNNPPDLHALRYKKRLLKLISQIS